MAEVIFEINEALYDTESGQAVFHPTVVSKLIRCKDCKYYRTEECYIHIERLWELKPTDYCSQAERN